MLNLFDKIIQVNTNSFSKSFFLLQQEAILANKAILLGFESMVKGGFCDYKKGFYYSAYFQISIGIERILKLIKISQYMFNNNYKTPSQKVLRDFGHNIQKMYEAVASESEDSTFDDISKYKSMLIFIDDFSKSKVRYHNISEQEEVNDPILKWKIIIDGIIKNDISTTISRNVKNKVVSSLNPSLVAQDITDNTGYCNALLYDKLVDKANYWAIWNIIELIRPLIGVLDNISSTNNNLSRVNDSLHIPYYSEMFSFVYTDKKTVLKRKIWGHL